MWISVKKYDELWDEKYKLQNDKDLLTRLLSGLVLFYGGNVEMPMPSNDSRAIEWHGTEGGTIKLKSKVYGLKNGKSETGK